MKLRKIIDIIEAKYPLNLSYDWDNVGLLVGDFDSDIKKVMTVIEANEDVIDEAIEKGADLIVTHHPFIFGKLNRVNTGDLKGKLIRKLIKNDVAVYSMHTNFDIAFDGLNDYFMELIGINETEVLDVIGSDENYCGGRPYGLGRVGNIPEEMSLREFCLKLKEILNMDCVRVTGNLEDNIKKVALVTGSGSEYVSYAKKIGADVFITGDMKYHGAQDAADIDMNVIDCGHFDTENIFRDIMYNFLSESLKDVEVQKSELNINPFKIVL